MGNSSLRNASAAWITTSAFVAEALVIRATPVLAFPSHALAVAPQTPRLKALRPQTLLLLLALRRQARDSTRIALNSWATFCWRKGLQWPTTRYRLFVTGLNLVR